MDAEAGNSGAGGRPIPAALELGLAFEQAAIGMALFGLDGQFLRVNQALCGLLGQEEMELVAKAVGAAAGVAARTGAGARVRGGVQPPPPFEVAHRSHRPDGTVVELLFSVTVLRDRRHRPLGLLAQAQDVTERNRATRALRTNEAWLRSVIANAPIVISVYDRDGICTFSEGRAFDRVGISPKERLGRSYVELRGDIAEATADFERLLAGEELHARREITPKDPNSEAIFDVHYGPLPPVDGDGGDVAGVISVAVDITDLERAGRERRALLHQLITAQENEQRRLAGNLHDDAIQALSAARMQLSVLDAAMDKLGVDAEGELRCAAKQVRGNLDHGLAAARTFLFDLRPPLLDREGLAPALGQQLDKLGQRRACKTQFRWQVPGRLDPDLEVLVFRVVQEALANVASHAGARRVRLRGRLRDGALEVEVGDDGVGFDQAEARERAMATGHLGLRSMAERLEAAGGELTIDAEPGHGARVRLRLPLPEAAGG
jgi:PAS domain S-box-containing protein